MPSLTECIKKLKEGIGKLTNEAMTQNYDGLGDLVFNSEDTAQAKEFAASLKNEMALNESDIKSLYSKKSLQSAWNIADTLSIIIRYTPCEWSAGFFRGLMASGTNGELNAYNLLISMFYMNENTSVVPYIVDDVTYEINRVFLRFTKELQLTNNGKSIVGLLKQLSHQFLGKSIIFDEEVIKAAETRIQAYEKYKAQLSPAQIETQDGSQVNGMIYVGEIPLSARYKERLDSLRASFEIDEDDGLTYYDARTGDEDEVCAAITAPALGFLVESLVKLHENREALGEEYNNTRELFLEMGDGILDENVNLESITGCILENKPLESFLKKEKSKKWIQSIGEAFDYLKQKIYQLLDSFRFKKSNIPTNPN